MATLMRLRRGFQDIYNRRGEQGQKTSEASYDLRCAFDTAKKWLESPEVLPSPSLDRLFLLMTVVYGIPEEELWNLRLSDVFEKPEP